MIISIILKQNSITFISKFLIGNVENFFIGVQSINGVATWINGDSVTNSSVLIFIPTGKKACGFFHVEINGVMINFTNCNVTTNQYICEIPQSKCLYFIVHNILKI